MSCPSCPYLESKSIIIQHDLLNKIKHVFSALDHSRLGQIRGVEWSRDEWARQPTDEESTAIMREVLGYVKLMERKDEEHS